MRKLLTLAAALAVALMMGAASADAGTAAGPEITDVSGDANFANGQGTGPGHEQGPSTPPASFASQDLLAVWFETAYTTTKAIDPDTGAVMSVQHAPAALLVHIKTQAPVHPISGLNRAVFYEVPVTLADCTAMFELRADPAGASKDTTTVWATSDGCGEALIGHGVASGLPTFDGTVATVTFSFSSGPSHEQIAWFVSAAKVVGQPSARVGTDRYTTGHGTIFPSAVVDEAAAGSSFTVGQDVPPNVDCAQDPTNPECQS